ncbi:PREDICTED: cytochrome P450 4c3-like [Dinoponera quadriceps]|uniref:Cytochrome P450 4c3-like n=1 Tax=Dinoponera quadriceps TaxID=609295 RepID=A0A6P3X6W2_DINQU|nr:PREDICTED: cytochrome P450 4c3-like [Dinoponera quadriceps]
MVIISINMIVALLLTCLCLALLYHYIIHRGRDEQLIDRIPGPVTLPILGNIQTWTATPEKLWYKLREWISTYYPIFKIRIFTLHSVFICNPDDMQKILNTTKHNKKGYSYNIMKPWLGEGLVTSTGMKWQQRRKILTPAFHFSILKQFVEILIEEGNRAAKSFKNNIQDRVRKEISNVMQENDGKLTMKALQSMPYLEMCLKESMRMYPSVPLISRECSEDVKLHSYLVPKGTTLHLLIYDLHHDPKIWPDPEVFNPDRFLLENIRNRHHYSYLPFSAGPRNCIGQRFALLELKALIAPLVYNFYLEPIDYLKDIRLKLDFVLRAVRPIRMKVIPIKRA